jgi:predicted nucleic acid-binding Zn ribbon protein
VSDALSRDAAPTEATLAGIADAVAHADRRVCPDCRAPITGRSDKKWCSDRCRKAAKRATTREGIRASRWMPPDPGMPKPADRTWTERDPQWTEHNVWSDPS